MVQCRTVPHWYSTVQYSTVLYFQRVEPKNTVGSCEVCIRAPFPNCSQQLAVTTSSQLYYSSFANHCDFPHRFVFLGEWTKRDDEISSVVANRSPSQRRSSPELWGRWRSKAVRASKINSHAIGGIPGFRGSLRFEVSRVVARKCISWVERWTWSTNRVMALLLPLPHPALSASAATVLHLTSSHLTPPSQPAAILPSNNVSCMDFNLARCLPPWRRNVQEHETRWLLLTRTGALVWSAPHCRALLRSHSVPLHLFDPAAIAIRALLMGHWEISEQWRHCFGNRQHCGSLSFRVAYDTVETATCHLPHTIMRAQARARRFPLPVQCATQEPHQDAFRRVRVVRGASAHVGTGQAQAANADIWLRLRLGAMDAWTGFTA